jgi:hypothetical protein
MNTHGRKVPVIIHLPKGEGLAGRVKRFGELRFTGPDPGSIIVFPEQYGVKGSFEVAERVPYTLESGVQGIKLVLRAAKIAKKYDPKQARDKTGKWILAEPGKVRSVVHPRVEPHEPQIPFRLRRQDRQLRDLPTGEYEMSRRLLDYYRSPWGFRVGQREHVKELTAKIKQEGFKKPVVLHVYKNVIVVKDGNHRLEAAYRLGLSKIPVKVVNKNRRYHFDHGYTGLYQRQQTERLRRELRQRSRYKQSTNFVPTWQTKVLSTVNAPLIARGQQ